MNENLELLLQTAKDLTERARGASVAGAKIAMRTRIWEEAPKFAQLGLLRVALQEGLNVGNVHAIHAQANPDRLAFVDSKLAWSFEEANDKINQVCHAFTKLAGKQRKPRVVLCMENRVEYALIWFALFRLGWPAVHASDSSTAEELQYLFESSKAAIVVASAKTIQNVEKAAPASVTIFNADKVSGDSRAIPLLRHIENFSRTHYRRKRNTSGENVVYTSGTTGKPKGAVRDFAQMGLLELVEILERMPITLQERHLVVSKLYHSAGQAFTLIMAALGATIFIEDGFDAEKIVKAIHDHQITSMFMVPTMISRVLKLDEEVFQKYPPDHLNVIVSGAGLFTHALREKAIRQFGPNTIYDFYGASELGWVTLISGTEMLQRVSSQGKPLRGQEIRIVDPETNQPLQAGEIGLIQVRTHSRMEGYLGNEAASQEILSDDNWMTVEDTGYLDKDGYLYLAGRARDMIISGGVNIYPAEIEEVLIRYQGVHEIAVVGAPDPDWGEKLVGCIVCDKQVKLDELETWARQHMTGYKIPRSWIQLDELPRNPTGKVLKKDLEVLAKDVKAPAKKAETPKKAASKPAAKQDEAPKKTATKKKATVKAPAKKAETPKKASSKAAVKTEEAPKKTAGKTASKPATKKADAPKKTASKPAVKKEEAPKKTASKTAVKKEETPKKAAPKTAEKKTDAKAKKNTPATPKSTAAPRTPKRARSPHGAARRRDS